MTLIWCWRAEKVGMLLFPVVTEGPKHLADDCPDFPKSSSDPHCGLRILIGRIFLSSHSHPSLNAACNNHLCRKVTVRMRTTFAERYNWAVGQESWHNSNFGFPFTGSYNSTFWSLALPCVPKIWPPDNTCSCSCFCPTSLPGSRKGSNFFSPAFLSFHIFVYFLHTNAVLFYTFLK